jgi:hypothetical protein
MGAHPLSVQVAINDVVVPRPDVHSLIGDAIFGLIVTADHRYYWGAPVLTLYGIHKLGGAASSAADITVVVS